MGEEASSTQRDQLREIARGFLGAAQEAARVRGSFRDKLVRAEPRQKAHILAVGKAALCMAKQASKELKTNLASGVIACPRNRLGGPNGVWETLSSWKAFGCDHPLPTRRNVAAARWVRDWMRSRPPQDVVLLLVSGGASAYLTLPMPGVRLSDLRWVTWDLQRRGATIHELNIVRKHLDLMKGGRLIAGCPAARIATRVLSDVIGDPLHTIASGLSVPDPSTYDDAYAVLRRYSLIPRYPRLAAHLHKGRRGKLPETPKPIASPCLREDRLTMTQWWHTDTTHDTMVVANNADIVVELAKHASQLGYRSVQVETHREGEARDCARRLIERARVTPAPSVHIMGGEWTVDVAGAKHVRGAGRAHGGPSQEFALAGAQLLQEMPGSVLLTYSTDGVDGPTSFAGGLVDWTSWEAMRRTVFDPAEALATHNSSSPLVMTESVISTHNPDTNLNHVAVLVRGLPDGSVATSW